jgi:anti-anti-sigma factor
MPGLEVTTSFDGGQGVVVTLVGECDLSTRDRVASAFADAVDRFAVVIVDLAGLTFIDSTGINELIAAHHAARAHDGRVYLRGASGTVATVLDVTGVATLLALPSGDDPGGDARR